MRAKNNRNWDDKVSCISCDGTGHMIEKIDISEKEDGSKIWDKECDCTLCKGNGWYSEFINVLLPSGLQQ